MLYRDNGICMDCVGRGPWNGVRYACYRGSRLQSIAVAVTISTQRRWVWPTNVDVVVALTDFAADLLKLSGVPPERVMVKPNTVEDPGPRAKAPSASRLLVYAGRLTEEKGIVDLIDAWSDADRQDLKLVVAGDGPLAAQVKARPSEGIEFLGWSDPEVVADLMSQARAVILPSRWFEGLPMVVIEAAARGTPVVVPDHGALAQVVGAGGWSYPSQDRAALSDLLSRLHREDVDTRGELARRNFEDHFSPDRGLESLESIYAAAQARSGLKT